MGQKAQAVAATTQTTVYRYDALGRRIDKTGSFGTTRFGWDGDLLTLESRGSRQSEYLYEPDSFVPLAKLESAASVQRPPSQALHPRQLAQRFRGQAGSEQNEAPALVHQARPAIETEAESAGQQAKAKDFSIFYYHCDQIGAPQELTDEQGRIVWAVDYKVWGRATALQVSATGTDNADPHDLNRFWPGGPRDLKALQRQQQRSLNEVEQNLRFQGQYFDAESGLHYNRFRYYDPQTGRFVHQDPIGLLGGLNAFRYAPNPFIWIDELGLQKKRGTTTCPIKKNEVTTYKDFRDRSVVGDKLEGHEVLQNAILKDRGLAGKRLDSDASKSNPVIALEKDTHTNVNREQIQQGTSNMPPRQSININCQILLNQGVPKGAVEKIKNMAIKHAKNLGLL